MGKQEFEDQPYPSSGGAMIDSELDKIPEGWRISNLGEIVINLDNKRIPISSKDRSKRQGKYRYFGASGIVDYIDDYIFDGEYILLSEDGDNLRSRKLPIVFLVNGRFWVNNYAHILQGSKNYLFYFVYLFLSRINITHIITGAVQPKVNKSNLHGLDVLIASEKDFIEFDQLIKPIFKKISTNKHEIQTLTKLRDALLPKLMSGEVRVER